MKLTAYEVEKLADDLGVVSTGLASDPSTFIYHASGDELLAFAAAIEAKLRAEYTNGESEAVAWQHCSLESQIISDKEKCTWLQLNPEKVSEYTTPLYLAPPNYQALEAQNEQLVEYAGKLRNVLEDAGRGAEAGLCYFTLISAREFLKDIRRTTEEALAIPLPADMKPKERNSDEN